jgi:tetratricopeptide (TPR) repeat protein
MSVGASGASAEIRTERDRRRMRTVALAVVLAAIVAAVYWPVRDAGYFYLDDDFYVTDNPFVRDGLTLTGLRQAFFGSRGALWMPLAFTSHMLDVSMFGPSPAGPHVVNVLLHVLNAVLLLALLHRTTGALAPSFAVAALFAVHPMRVESVAWVAERKDVLSALFGLVTLHAWVAYTRAPSERTYRHVVGATILALLTKPMLVTLPLLLVCFDCWPLRRLGTIGPDGRRLTVKDLVVEKLPLLALAVAAAAITLVAAGAQGALVTLDGRPLSSRIAHAIVSYVWYAWKTAWPTRLAIFYPYPAWSGWQIAGALLVIGTTALVAAAMRRRAPWIASGLAWFVVGLAPVIGIFQAGGQGMADRFTYVPAIGLLVAVVWSLDAAVRTRGARAALAGAGVVFVAVLVVVAHRQASYWRTNEALFERTLAVTTDNWRVESALGNVLANAGRYDEALPHFATSFRIRPDDPGAHYGLGLALHGLGRVEDAVDHYREAIRIDPTFWRAHNNLGTYLIGHGDVDAALYHFSEAVRLNPNAEDATANLRSALALAGFPKEHSEGYLRGLVTWSHAIANDRDGPGGAAYGALLGSRLLAARSDLVQECVGPDGDGHHAPFSLYVQVDATGALTAVTAMPPTPAARCVRDELRTAHAPAPPFAPFHATVSIPGEG